MYRSRTGWQMALRIALALAVSAIFCASQSTPTWAQAPAATNQWQAVSPRAEIRPLFGDPSNDPAPSDDPASAKVAASSGPLVIATDERLGLQGWWQKFVPVEAERWYRFSVRRLATGVKEPRREVFARIDWRDDAGRQVNFDEPVVDFYARGGMREATPEFPTDQDTDLDAEQTNSQPTDDAGWTTLAGVYRAPAGARRAVIELHLQWATNARVEWRDVTLVPCEAPTGRRVRLAAVHYSPNGKTPQENCRQFEPLIVEAARQKADLIVLPETVTLQGTGLTYADVAESIPGPSTEFFSKLAREHHVTLVVGLVERAEHLIYNVAVLIGPDGSLLGKYRKVCLPRGEIELGVMPGDAYPVFRTPWGKVGLMVCYDGFFPEVARELANRGAEVIAFPVAGCNPELVAARACENHVYLVSSSYTDAAQHWTVTGIYDHQGQLLKQADKWGTIAVAEVDLDRPTRWANLGDFKAQLPRHRPADPADPAQQ